MWGRGWQKAPASRKGISIQKLVGVLHHVVSQHMADGMDFQEVAATTLQDAHRVDAAITRCFGEGQGESSTATHCSQAAPRVGPSELGPRWRALRQVDDGH